MKNTMKKILCVLLVVVMCLTSVPLSGFVGLELPEMNFGEWFGSKASAAEDTLATTGQCGDNVYWNYNSTTGELVIGGTGPMTDHSYNSPFCYNSSITSVVIKDGVTSIGDSAFYGCKSLASVTITDSVTSIGEGAFEWCESLESIEIPDSVTSIGEGAFYHCTSLASITIPDSVTRIGYNAFYNTAYYNNSDNWQDNVLCIGNHLIEANDSISGVYEIKEKTKCIADHAFYNCGSLVSVTIPDSVTSIGERAFYNCTSLKSITVDEDNEYYSSENGVLFNKDETILIQYPVGNSRTSYSIPDSVTSIDEGAFEWCASLVSVTIGNSVASIEGWAFAYCESLESIEIPDSVTSIGEGAFDFCTSLASIEIPDSVTSIGDAAFLSCYSCTKFEVEPENEFYSSDECGVLFNKDKTILIQYPLGNTRTSYDIPDSVTDIEMGAFLTALNLEEIIIPENVETIDYGAFQQCFNLTRITIQNGVKTIDDTAFRGAPFLKEVIIEDMDVEFGQDSICSTTFTISGISREEFVPLCIKYFSNEIPTEDIEKYFVYSDDMIYIGTIYCHAGSTAEAYAIENGVDYVLTHFFKGEWTYDYDNMIRTRKCIHCDELETEPLETTENGDVEIIEPVAPDISDCNCICHKEGFFFEILASVFKFVAKLLGVFPVCDCGIAHY